MDTDSGVTGVVGEGSGLGGGEVSSGKNGKVLTGSGTATKMQLEKSVRHHLNLSTPIRPYHAADAMALALIGLFRFEHPMCRGRAAAGSRR